MAIITITSDWGTRDHYVAVLHGKIYSMINDARIVDISHSIKPFNNYETAFILRNAYKSFPKGTIHIIGVNTIEHKNAPHAVMVYDGHFFICADNGIFSLICDGREAELYTVTVHSDDNYYIFPSRDVFVKVAAHIAEGKPLHALGTKYTNMNKMEMFKPVIHENIMKGVVVYVDNYGNAISNISEAQFYSFVKNKKYRVIFRSADYFIEHLSESYDDEGIAEGDMLALISTTGFLEFSVRRGNASELLGLKVDSPVMVEIQLNK